MEQVSDVSALWNATIAASVTRRVVTYSIFGQDVALGEADYEMPLMKAVEVTPLGEPPHTSARVSFEPAESADTLPFRMVDSVGG